MWEIITIFGIMIFASFMLHRYEFDSNTIILYNIYVIMLLALEVIINYVYFVICALIIAILFYFKLTKKKEL